MPVKYFTRNTINFNGLTISGLTVVNSFKDSYLQVATPPPAYNFGGSTSLKWSGGAYASGECRPIISSLFADNIAAGSTINSVELWFCGNGLYNDAEDDVGFYRITDPHVFVEGTGLGSPTTDDVTWVNYATGAAWDTAGAAHNLTQLGWWDISLYHTNGTFGQVTDVDNGLKNYIQNIINGAATDYGLLGKGLHLDGVAADSCYSSEGDDGFRPYWKVDYTEPSGPSTLVAFVS